MHVVNRTSSSNSYTLTLSGGSLFLPYICLSHTSPDWGLVASWGGRIYKITFQTNSFETFVGQSANSITNGYGTNARFNGPQAISLSPDDSYALVADYNNHLIRKITMTTAFVDTFAGTSGSAGAVNGVGTNAKLNLPASVSISPDGNFAVVSNFGSHIINRIILSTVEVSLLAGTVNSQ